MIPFCELTPTATTRFDLTHLTHLTIPIDNSYLILLARGAYERHDDSVLQIDSTATTRFDITHLTHLTIPIDNTYLILLARGAYERHDDSVLRIDSNGDD